MTSRLESLVRDVRLGLRMLRKHFGVTAASIVSLALALGACVAAFSLVDALILRPLPVPQSDRLIYLAFPTYTPERPEADTFNDPLFTRLRDAGRNRVDLFAMSTQVIRPLAFADAQGEKERVRTQFASGDAFALLGVVPAAGRLIARQDDATIGAHPVAVLSHAFWLRRFGGNPAVIGTWFAWDERRFQIVGVSEARFTGVEPGRPTDVWMPYSMYNPRAFGNAQFNWFRIIGRLKDRVSPEQAQTVLQVAFTNFRREFAPHFFGPQQQSPDRLARFLGAPIYVRSAANGPSPLRKEFERPLWILALIAGLILLIAGSNVADLFMARGAAREREMSLRLSIGAGRGRLIQQMLVESTLVAVAASASGLVFAMTAAPMIVRMLAAPDDPVHLDLRLDWPLAAFATCLTLVTTALFGLAPALRASNVAPVTALKSDGTRSSPRAGVMRPFVAVQIAFSLVVLFVGSLLVLSFTRLTRVNPGFAASDVLLISVETVQRLEPAAQRRSLFEALERIRDINGVQSASLAEFNVLGRAWTQVVRVPGTQYDTVEATVAPVSAEFFETMNIPVLSGRTFVRRDIEPNPTSAIIVNQSFATRYFGTDAVVGRTVDTRFGAETESGLHEIIGVVADARYDLRKPAAPALYIPFRANGTFAVRATGDTAALAPRLRDSIRTGSPLLRVTTILTQSAAIDQTLLRERLMALLSGYFAVIGLLLAGVGLYGVLSHSVVQRTREIGIRMALGAPQLRVVRTVVGDIGMAALIGAGAGLAGGLYFSRFVQSLLFDVKPLEFWSLALPLATLFVAAALAGVIPAIRAARVDPAIALRSDA
jgi:predicted permease